MNKKKYEFANELFAQMKTTPFSKISISDICNNLHCSRQSFYYYFKTLDDCLIYFVQESFKSEIKDNYLISDLFNYFEKNDAFVRLCGQDQKSNDLFWKGLLEYTKKMMDIIFSKNLDDYLELYIEQRDAITNFYAAGLLVEVRNYTFNNHAPSKEKCISYCKSIIGNGDDNRNMMRRFLH